MERAVPTSPLWWVARQWLRFLTGLAILVVAVGVSGPARATGTATPPSTPIAGPAAVTGSTSARGAEAYSRETVRPADVAVAEPDSDTARPAPLRLPRQRPAPVTWPAAASVAAVGQRAPPAGGVPAVHL